MPSTDHVVTLNWGGGRDSTTMLALLLDGELVVHGRRVGPEFVDAVVLADTGAEWPHTYDAMRRIVPVLVDRGLRVLQLRKPAKGDVVRGHDRLTRQDTIEHRAQSGWYHLREHIVDDYSSRSTVVSIGKGDCTDNHKIAPIRKVIHDLSLEKGLSGNRSHGHLVRIGSCRPHLTLIGIAADEAQRASVSADSPDYVSEAFPLIEMGIAKDDEAAILARWGWNDVRKSGCYCCPYQPPAWWWALQETQPALWAEMQAYEAKSLAQNDKMFVTGKCGLEAVIKRWREKNPNVTIDEALDKAYARGGKAA